MHKDDIKFILLLIGGVALGLLLYAGVRAESNVVFWIISILGISALGTLPVVTQPES